MRQGFPQHGGSILKKGFIVDHRTFKSDCLLFLWREVHAWYWGKQATINWENIFVRAAGIRKLNT